MFCAAIAALATSGFAQLPASRVLTLDVAETIATEAMAACRAGGYRATVVVVDHLNATRVLLRDDGATASTAEVARMKATSAMLYDRPSGPAAPAPAAIPGTIDAYGGVPITIGGVTIGAVGISATPGGAGASGVDVSCANAGLAKVADRLK